MTREAYGPPDERWRGRVLWALLGAFVLRVAGQVVVGVTAPSWLPPMEQWYSGILPYPLLLPTQIVLIGLMARLAHRATRHVGRMPGSPPSRGVWLARASFLYAAVMLVRYGVQLAIRPEWRWFGHTIPIAFHLVLATWLYVLAGAMRAPSRPRRHASAWRLAGGVFHSIY
jgi:hypothetical protein